MYTISNIIFYEESDDKEVIISKYVELKKSKSDLDEDALIAEAEYMYSNSVETLVFFIAQIQMEDALKEYENHWISFLSSAYGFDASIVEFNASYSLMMCRLIGVAEDNNKVVKFMEQLVGLKFLKIPIVSSLVNKYGQNLKITNEFIMNILTAFGSGSYLMDDAIYIKYAPSPNIYAAITLTRLLHLYM